MAKPDWDVKRQAACFKAGKIASPADFRQVRRGLVLSRRQMWQRENPIPLAYWPDKVTLVVLDGGKKHRGKLMLIKGQIAYEVQTSVDTLLAIYEPHQVVKWWKDQRLHRCERVA